MLSIRLLVVAESLLGSQSPMAERWKPPFGERRPCPLTCAGTLSARLGEVFREQKSRNWRSATPLGQARSTASGCKQPGVVLYQAYPTTRSWCRETPSSRRRTTGRRVQCPLIPQRSGHRLSLIVDLGPLGFNRHVKERQIPARRSRRIRRRQSSHLLR